MPNDAGPTATPANSRSVKPEARKRITAATSSTVPTRPSGIWATIWSQPDLRFLVVTECGLTDRLAMEVPEKQFLKGCKLCTFMKGLPSRTGATR